jgi:DNA invertase Pin-like site-specific DNA recombinase
VLALAQRHEIDAVLVTELSRWGRSTTDLLATLKELEARRVSLVALNGMAFDLSTPHGRMMATVLAGLAEFERELIQERIRSGLAAAKARGKSSAGSPGSGRSRIGSRPRCWPSSPRAQLPPDRSRGRAEQEHRRRHRQTATLCRVVGASVSGFYAWLRAIPSRQNRAEAEAALRGHISRIFAAKRRVYGAPRIHAELRREGHRHARRRIERLMRDMGLQAQRGRRRRPQTTDSRHDLPIAPNLLGRSFVAERPDTVWLADISYIPTDEGFLYLAALKDLATREIVGWSMAEHLKAGSASTPWSWPSSAADRHGGSFIIATADRNTPLGRIGRCWSGMASSHR